MITGCIGLRVLEQSWVKCHQQNVRAWLSDRPEDVHSSAQLCGDMCCLLPKSRGTWATWVLFTTEVNQQHCRLSSFCSKPAWASAALLLPKHFVELTQCTTLIWTLLPGDCRTCHEFCIIDFGKQYFPRWLSPFLLQAAQPIPKSKSIKDSATVILLFFYCFLSSFVVKSCTAKKQLHPSLTYSSLLTWREDRSSSSHSLLKPALTWLCPDAWNIIYSTVCKSFAACRCTN